MKGFEEIKQITFDSVPEVLKKFRRETIGARGTVVFQKKHNIFISSIEKGLVSNSLSSSSSYFMSKLSSEILKGN
jgi:hypothetical protein